MQEEEFNFLFEITKTDSNKINEKKEQIEKNFEINYSEDKLIEFIKPLTIFKQDGKEVTESQGFLGMEDDLQNLGLISKEVLLYGIPILWFVIFLRINFQVKILMFGVVHTRFF